MDRAQENELIRRAVDGDREAAAMCIRAHQGSVYSYILRMSGRPDVAEDVVQEAFVRVLSNLDRFDPRYRFSTWVFTIARRVYLNMAQKHRPAPDSETVERAMDKRAGPEAGALRSDLSGTLGGALRQLNETQREVVILFHQFDWTIALIARHLDLPEGTVKSHLHRGRRRLREILADSEWMDQRREDLHS